MYDFQVFFKTSRTLLKCKRRLFGTLSCHASTDTDPNNYSGFSVKVDHPGKYFSISKAPNKKDIWLSGGRGVTLRPRVAGGLQFATVFIEKTITIMR